MSSKTDNSGTGDGTDTTNTGAAGDTNSGNLANSGSDAGAGTGVGAGGGSTGNPSSAGGPAATPGTTSSDPAAATPTTQALEQPFFTVTSKPADGSGYTDLATALKAAADMATLHPGTEIYVLEARKFALSPKPDVQEGDLSQV